MKASSGSRVLRFAPGAANGLRCPDARFFLLDTDGTPVMANARCSHRGGPLHLGALNSDRTNVICPMHRLGTPVQSLQRRALPMILRKDELVVIVPEEFGGLSPIRFHAGWTGC